MRLFLLADLFPFITTISVAILAIVLLCLLLKRLHQPYIVAYILVGVLLGESGIGLVERNEALEYFGEIGIILLLFFVGMEIDLPKFKEQWRVALFGTLLQVGGSVGAMVLIGYLMGWGMTLSVVLGFVVALSSSAVIIRILEERKMTATPLGRNVLSILLTQDVLIAPLVIITALLGGQSQSTGELALMIVGASLFVLIVGYIYRKRRVRLPFSKNIESDHELQVFVALLFCFGGALLSSFFHLSAALGAFVGGMVMHAGKATHWIHDTLLSFRVLFVSVFFVSVGLQVDFNFVIENWFPLSLGLGTVYLTNHLVNATILRFFSDNWREALLGGALLAQIGELSFLISATAFSLGIFEGYAYHFTISLICITLVVSPLWILMTERLLGERRMHDRGRVSV